VARLTSIDGGDFLFEPLGSARCRKEELSGQTQVPSQTRQSDIACPWSRRLSWATGGRGESEGQDKPSGEDGDRTDDQVSNPSR